VDAHPFQIGLGLVKPSQLRVALSSAEERLDVGGVDVERFCAAVARPLRVPQPQMAHRQVGKRSHLQAHDISLACGARAEGWRTPFGSAQQCLGNMKKEARTISSDVTGFVVCPGRPPIEPEPEPWEKPCTYM